MTGDVVNLRLHRKRKLRDERAALANENRARHGRTKDEKTLSGARVEQSETKLSGHLRERPEAED